MEGGMSISVRARRIIARVSMAVSFAVLVLLVAVPALRHRAPLGGWGIVASTVVSLLAGLAYLRSTGGRAMRGQMSEADGDRWASARTLADVGEMTARWLEGEIASQPGYCGPSDIEDPALVPLLARLNRAGFVTTGSQIGESGWGHGGAWWEQCAAVEGFADARMASRLARVARAAGMTVVLHCPAELPRWRYRYHQAVTVTRRDGGRYTAFGVQVPRRHIRDSWLGYGICHPDAVKALCGAWQVTLIDPEWGRPDVLWCVLERAIWPGGSTS
jgi:hypothetical protein